MSARADGGHKRRDPFLEVSVAALWAGKEAAEGEVLLGTRWLAGLRGERTPVDGTIVIWAMGVDATSSLVVAFFC